MKQNKYSEKIIGMQSSYTVSEEIRSIAKNISLVILDIDGVMTDGSLYYDEKGRVTKSFSCQDGLGIRMLMKAGIGVSVITGAESKAVSARLRTLGITEHYRGQKNKQIAFEDILSSGIHKKEQIAYMGDDWIDLCVMEQVALPIAVANAQPEVQEKALLITENAGGNGAIREVVRFLLVMQNKFESTLQRYL